MNCSIKGCPGKYESKVIVHTVRRGDELIVIENVPADVCNICSDTLLAPDTVRHLEKIIERRTAPEKYAPLYDYA
jgi:YgiT-type zinc finger domain-containing protein